MARRTPARTGRSLGRPSHGRAAGPRGDLPRAARMNGVLRTALQFYTRTRAQRWMLAGALSLLAAELVAASRTCPCPRFNPWPFLLGGLACSIAAGIIASGAWDFRRISAQRTVFLIPHSRLQLAAGMLLAQVAVAGVGAGIALLAGH